MARRFLMNPKYDLWFDNPNSVAEEIRFNDDSKDHGTENASVNVRGNKS